MGARRLDWTAASLFAVNDPAWRDKLRRGGWWLLLCPPAGWLMALGYRKEVVMNLVHGEAPVLPAWSGRDGRFFLEGLKALGVIAFYFVPFFVCLWSCALEDWTVLAEHPLEFVTFFALVFGLLPIGMPGTPTLYAATYDWFTLSSGESLALAALAATTTFVIPAGFMQVSRRGRFLDALRPGAVLSIFRDHFRGYTEAWICSASMSALALASGPLAPFGIVWSYQGIVYCFNEVLLESPDPARQTLFARSHFQAIAARGQSRAEAERRALVGDDATTLTIVTADGDAAVVTRAVEPDAVTLTAVDAAGRRRSARLTDVWRPFLTERRGLVEHYLERMTSPRGELLQPTFAALVFGPLRVPLPRMLTPRYRMLPTPDGGPA